MDKSVPSTSFVKKKKKKRKKREDERNIECPDCGKKFFYKSNLDQHKLVHTGEKPFACKVCGKAFNSTYSLKTHNYIHTDEKPFKCSFCKYACRDTSTLRKHQARHMGLEKVYRCKLCDKSYKEKCKLKVHVSEIHLHMDVRKVPCSKCGRMFKSKSEVSRHIKSVHNREYACRCPVCDVYLPNRYNLSAHLDSHMDTRPYICNAPACGRRFKDRGTLRKHVVIHSPEEQFPCEICGRRFARRSRLVRHVETVHGKMKRVECDYCAQRFYSKAYLINHITKKHVSRSKYICDTCGFKSGNKPGLVSHIRRGHDKENDRECKICHTIYKKHIYLKHHYKYTHKIAYKTKTRRKPIIKEEPPDDVASVHSIDLFEVDKEEPGLESNLGTEGQPEGLDLETIVEGERLNGIPDDLFDQLYVEVGKGDADKSEKESTQKSKEKSAICKVDQKAYEHAKKEKKKYLEEARRKEMMRALEKTRQIYNERINKFLNTTLVDNKEPLKIKLFRKTRVNKYDNRPTTRNDNNEMASARRSRESTADQKTELTTKNDSDINTSSDDIITSKNDKITSNNDKITSSNDKDVSINGKSDISVRYSENDANDNVVSKNDKKDVVGVKNKRRRRKPKRYQSESDDEYQSDDDVEWSNRSEKKKNRKLNFNSHQCYICFKLYETKEKLLDHCKDHFDVCNEKFLKKCPLCPYVTKLTIGRHLKLRHGVNIKIPYARIKDKKNNTNGSRYYFEIDDETIKTMEVIPSVKNLNKIASMKLDKKAKENKSKMLAKTKLVRKGKEWIVETEKINIDKDVIIPKFDSDDFKKLNTKVMDKDSYFDSLKKMSHLAKKNGQTMMFPCQSCEKICRNFAALKLHNRKHEANPKPFKKKVWKHKLKTKEDNTKNVKTKNVPTDNRTAKPKPIKNKHKCDPTLKDFYEKNIRGGDIEFWQFLKIFNKMSRDNIRDFKDLEGRYEYGIENRETDEVNDLNSTEIEDSATVTDKILTNTEQPKPIKKRRQAKVNKNTKIEQKSKGCVRARVIRISKKLHMKRNLEKQKLREKIAQNKIQSTLAEI